MKKGKIILITIVVVLIALNTPPLKWIVGREDISYSNATGSFTFEEMNFKGRNYDMCLYRFNIFKDTARNDTILYRLDRINFLKFWRWSNYLSEYKYKLPYKSWQDIALKKSDTETKSGFQDF
jgi:hypothetical protein